MNAKNIANEIG